MPEPTRRDVTGKAGKARKQSDGSFEAHPTESKPIYFLACRPQGGASYLETNRPFEFDPLPCPIPTRPNSVGIYLYSHLHVGTPKAKAPRNTDHGVAATTAVKTVMPVHARRSMWQSSTIPASDRVQT